MMLRTAVSSFLRPGLAFCIHTTASAAARNARVIVRRTVVPYADQQQPNTDEAATPPPLLSLATASPVPVWTSAKNAGPVHGGGEPRGTSLPSGKVEHVSATDGGENGAPRPSVAKRKRPSPRSETTSKFLGVLRDGPSATLWEAVVVANGREISGGEYETQEEAARAYDALARMYLGSDAPTNFPSDPYTSWVPPDAVAATGQIQTLPGKKLTAEEIVAALQQERGIDIQVVDLAGKSSIAEHLIFVTGKSVPHMRKMADMVSRALRKRRIKGVDASVEGREMDDWMVVDAENIIVNVMDAEAREVFDLERFYTNMKLGEDPYAGQTYEEWLHANPIPEKWLTRLEKDEAELSMMSAKSKR